jgi:hypothetical protein
MFLICKWGWKFVLSRVSCAKLIKIICHDFYSSFFIDIMFMLARWYILKQLFASGSVIIGEYSPRLRLGEYLAVIPWARVGYEVINNQRGSGRVGYNHLISNKREWNNCFIKYSISVVLHLKKWFYVKLFSVRPWIWRVFNFHIRAYWPYKLGAGIWADNHAPISQSKRSKCDNRGWVFYNHR